MHVFAAGVSYGSGVALAGGYSHRRRGRGSRSNAHSALCRPYSRMSCGRSHKHSFGSAGSCAGGCYGYFAAVCVLLPRHFGC